MDSFEILEGMLSAVLFSIIGQSSVLRSLRTEAFFGTNFGANSVKKIGLTLSQSRLHTARRNFVRIIIFRIRVNLFRFSQLSPLGPLLSLSLSLSLFLLSVSPWPADFGFPTSNEITRQSAKTLTVGKHSPCSLLKAGYSF